MTKAIGMHAAVDQSFGDQSEAWVGLAIGNSRSHWAYVHNSTLVKVWAVPHRSAMAIPGDRHWQNWISESPAFQYHQQVQGQPFPRLWFLSVVPQQSSRWRAYPQGREVHLADIPLRSTYPTLGVDRALAVWAAGTRYGWPVLVVDCGTALTFTGADATGDLVGGAIVPGLGVQLRSLHQSTAALPHVQLSPALPHRWAIDTPTAIQSGILHTLVAGIRDFIEDWLQQYPNSSIILTGGDHQILGSKLDIIKQEQWDSYSYKNCSKLDPYLLVHGLIMLKEKLN